MKEAQEAEQEKAEASKASTSPGTLVRRALLVVAEMRWYKNSKGRGKGEAQGGGGVGSSSNGGGSGADRAPGGKYVDFLMETGSILELALGGSGKISATTKQGGKYAAALLCSRGCPPLFLTI